MTGDAAATGRPPPCGEDHGQERGRVEGRGQPDEHAGFRLPAKMDSFPTAREASVRYSRFVGAMKVLLPVVAVGLIAAVVLLPRMNLEDERFRVGYSDVRPADAENPRMVNARFTGTDGVARPYSITADMATRLGQHSPFIELEDPKADLTLEDGSWVALMSRTGMYNQDSNDLELRDEVSLFHDDGYEFRTESAHIDLENGSAYGNDSVQGQGPFGLLDADGFRIRDQGKTIVFLGPARLVIFPEAQGPEG